MDVHPEPSEDASYGHCGGLRCDRGTGARRPTARRSCRRHLRSTGGQPGRWGLLRHASAVLPQGLPALHRCDNPPAGPPRVAYRRGSRPARGRDQRTPTTGSTIAGHQDGHGGIDQALAYRAEIIPGVNLAAVAEAAEERAAWTATAIRWPRGFTGPRSAPGRWPAS